MRRAGFIPVLILTMGSFAHAGVYLTIIRRPDPGPSARQMAAIEAKREIDAAEASLRQAAAEAARNHPLNAEIQDAQRKVLAAQRELAAARENVKAKLDERPDYHKLAIQLRLIDDHLSAENDQTMRSFYATERLAIRKEMSAIESEAMGSDVYVTLGLAGVVETAKTLHGLQERYQSLLVQNPGFAAAKARLDAARQRMANIG